MFSVCNDYGQYSQQMVPSEVLEQLMAWGRYLPAVIIFRKSIFRSCQSIMNILSRRSQVNPANQSGGTTNITETEETIINRIRGIAMANMEWGEDISYIMAA